MLKITPLADGTMARRSGGRRAVALPKKRRLRQVVLVAIWRSPLPGRWEQSAVTQLSPRFIGFEHAAAYIRAVTASAAPRRVHLRAGAGALAALALGLAVAWTICVRTEDHWVDAILSQARPEKDVSLAWQRAALREPDVLPLYGTSELEMPMPALAGDYFATRPTGFAVEPLGQPGATSLIMAQRIAALARELRGRKVAVTISPSFFHITWDRPQAYASNFSPLLAGECLYSNVLSRPLRQRFAERLDTFPETLRRRPMLASTALHLQRDSVAARVGEELLAPLGRAQNLLYAFQDHAAALEFLREHEPELAAPTRSPQALDWPAEQQRYSAVAKSFPDPHPSEAQKRQFHAWSASGGYRHAMLQSPEWQDFELLLDTAHELHVHLLVLVIPLNGVYLDELGVRREDRAFSYDCIESICYHHHADVRNFREWDEDAAFFHDTHDHITSKAWILIDRTLDDFYHDRPLASPVVPPAPKRPPGGESSPMTSRPKLS
jgi:D-alanine transfer protein